MPGNSGCYADCMDSIRFVDRTRLIYTKVARMNLLASRLKWIGFLIVVAILVIIVFQNLAQTEVYILFSTVAMPQAALLTMALVIGFALGVSANALWKIRARRARSAQARKDATASTFKS